MLMNITCDHKHGGLPDDLAVSTWVCILHSKWLQSMCHYQSRKNSVEDTLYSVEMLRRQVSLNEIRLIINVLNFFIIIQNIYHLNWKRIFGWWDERIMMNSFKSFRQITIGWHRIEPNCDNRIVLAYYLPIWSQSFSLVHLLLHRLTLIFHHYYEFVFVSHTERWGHLPL